MRLLTQLASLGAHSGFTLWTLNRMFLFNVESCGTTESKEKRVGLGEKGKELTSKEGEGESALFGGEKEKGCMFDGKESEESEEREGENEENGENEERNEKDDE